MGVRGGTLHRHVIYDEKSSRFVTFSNKSIFRGRSNTTQFRGLFSMVAFHKSEICCFVIVDSIDCSHGSSSA